MTLRILVKKFKIRPSNTLGVTDDLNYKLINISVKMNSDAESLDLSDIVVLSDMSYDHLTKPMNNHNKIYEIDSCIQSIP